MFSLVELPEGYSEPSQTSKMEPYARVLWAVNSFRKCSILDISQCSEYASFHYANVFAVEQELTKSFIFYRGKSMMVYGHIQVLRVNVVNSELHI